MPKMYIDGRLTSCSLPKADAFYIIICSNRLVRINLKTHLIILNIVCDTDQRRFEVSEAKLEKLESLLKEALYNRFI